MTIPPRIVLAEYVCGCSWVGVMTACATHCRVHRSPTEAIGTLTPEVMKEHGITNGWCFVSRRNA